MSRDHLLPPGVSKVHPRFGTPYITTIITGIAVALFAAVIPINVVGEMTSIGTLFAFVVVCTAVLIMRRIQPDLERPFRAPLGMFTPIAGIATCMLLMFSLAPENWYRLVIWLAVGLFVYFFYSRHHSVMARYLAGEIAHSGVSARVGDVRDHDPKVEEM
jgi:APA family basic amino acid/polyamine antiporter